MRNADDSVSRFCSIRKAALPNSSFQDYFALANRTTGR